MKPKNPYGKNSRGNDSRWKKGALWAQDLLAKETEPPDLSSSVVKTEITSARKAAINALARDKSNDEAVDVGLGQISHYNILKTSARLKKAQDLQNIASSKSGFGRGDSSSAKRLIKNWDPFWKGVFDVGDSYEQSFHAAVYVGKKYNDAVVALFMDKIAVFLETSLVQAIDRTLTE